MTFNLNKLNKWYAELNQINGQESLAEFYEPAALLRSDEAPLVGGQTVILSTYFLLALMPFHFNFSRIRLMSQFCKALEMEM